MSAFFASGIALAYVSGVIGLHRLNVVRMRRAAGGFPSLRWLDWDTLLSGLGSTELGPNGCAPSSVYGGGPIPMILRHGFATSSVPRMKALGELVGGKVERLGNWDNLGFSGGEQSWLSTLEKVVESPNGVLAELEFKESVTAAESYLREYLSLTIGTNALNLEWGVFVSKRRLGRALDRFGNHPALYYVRALASSLLGMNQSAVDDLARAVYFSQQHPFYLEAVLASHYVSETRPALALQCQNAGRRE